MHPHEIHHIKAYVVFFLFSASLIGLLVYLYIPDIYVSPKDLLKSLILQETPVPAVTSVGGVGSNKNIGEPSSKLSLENIEADASERRMRLVKILIRSQKELQTLENQRIPSSKGLDTASEEKINKLREKIITVEGLIKEIK